MKSSLEVSPACVETRRGPVECAVTGSGPAVLSLHGAMGGYDQGLLLIRTTIAHGGFRFVAISRPGYLGTPLELGRTPEEQADVCAETLDALGIGDAAVIAVSGGGPCALQFALRHAGRCRALVMVAGCGERHAEGPPFAYQIMKLTARVPGVAEIMRRRAARVRERTLRDPEAAGLLMELQSSTVRSMSRRLPGTDNDIAQTRSLPPYPFENIQAPALLVYGTADRLVPFEQARSMAARIPRAELLAVNGGEHVAIFTHRELTRAHITEFLDRHSIATV